jgi:hypothetical protein
MNIVKRPTPKNFRTCNVCISTLERDNITTSDTLTVLKYASDEVLLYKPITQKMIASLQLMTSTSGDYYLMSYKD